MIYIRIAVAAALICAPLAAEDQLHKINVAALDRSGAPVTGLQASDFQLQEDGKARPIAFLRFTGREHANRIATPPNVTVVLIDLLNGGPLSAAVIGEQFTSALKKLESSDGLYLYFLTVGGDLYPVHPLPSSDAEVARGGQPWTQNLTPTLQAALKSVVSVKPIADRVVNIRYDSTMKAIQELGARMALVSGRKNLVWATGGLPPNPLLDQLSNQLAGIAEQLERAQIVAYPVGGMGLGDFSSLTGGRVFGSLGDAIPHVIADSSANYQIAYYAAAEPDGKLHKLHLTCVRKDAHLQWESGFYASPAAQPGEVEKTALAIAIRSPFDAAEIGLRATASPDPAKPSNTRFEIRINPADLLLGNSKGQRTGKVDLVFAAYGPSGSEQLGDPMRLDVNLTPDQYAAAVRDGMAFRPSVALSATVRKVRVIVVDGKLGAAGSITIPVNH